MDSYRIALRYAKALVDVTKENERQIKQLEALQQVAELFQIEAAKKVLLSPVMPKILQEELLDYAVQTVCSDNDLKAFLKTIVTANRIDVLPAIAQCFAQILDEKNDVENIVVESAHRLTPQQTEELQGFLAKELGKKIKLTQTINPALLGGFVVRYAGKVLDCSMLSYLNKLAQETN